ncbi:hypothetical protein GGS24DRAFT_201367 [Hypoxylon argillaceum]|nr:hypothetical protein GGS24DRAFT_201367 [Hypoxylon argillaceum]
MEDANLNETIAEHTESGDVHLDRTRWWFASAAFPMVAGTLGPVASAFSICALVKPWRQNILPGSVITEAVFIDDPSWLIAINAVQLIIALIANFFLLLNMTKRVRFSVAQPITIVGWYISSFLLTALCATASGPLLSHSEINQLVWSQAFYYGLFAAVLYFIVASLMVVTVWGAKAGHYPSNFELTMSQRTLMLQTILFLTYLLVGALIFSHVEGWIYLDAVYWADVTLFTVGLGDIPLTTQLGRGLMIPYALIGITTLGLVIGSIRSLMLDRGKKRLDARMLEKRRRRFVDRLMQSNKGEVLEPVNEQNIDDYPELKQEDTSQAVIRAELQRRHKEFHLMRKIQEQASTRRRWMAMGISTGTWVVLWLVGAKVFQECESEYQDWVFFDGVYFAFQAMSTIGYGDRTPISNAGKSFFVFWSLLALPTLTILISNAGDTIVKGIRDATVLLGNITILPGERGYKMDIKHFLSRLSFGVLFTENTIHELPAGFLGAAMSRHDEDEDEPSSSSSSSLAGQHSGGQQAHTEARTSSTPRSRGTNATSTQESTAPKPKDVAEKTKRRRKKKLEPLNGEGIPGELPKTRAEYRLLLIDEIRRVSQHLQHSPPLEYTYQEWAWYLRLIGEDESDVSTHRRPKHDTQGSVGSHDGEESDKPKWSWVGHRSPLMDTRDEAEWILDKLTQKLRLELQAAVEQSEGEDGVRETEDMEERSRNTRNRTREPFWLGKAPLETV